MISRTTYFVVTLLLMGLLGLTYWAYLLELPPLLSVTLALGLAAAKMALILIYFMHLRVSGKITTAFACMGLLWLAILFGLTLTVLSSIVGIAAALALELEKLLNEPKLRPLAYANLQWLAGLNAGITRENLKASVVYTTELPEGVAVPISQMCNTGNRWGGTWFQTRGVICNGFSTGTQFKMDTEPIAANDGPSSFTDEDWIPHSAGWLSGLVRL